MLIMVESMTIQAMTNEFCRRKHHVSESNSSERVPLAYTRLG